MTPKAKGRFSACATYRWTPNETIFFSRPTPFPLSALRASLPLHSLRFPSLAGWLSTASNMLPHVFNLIAPPPRDRTSGVDLARSAKVGLLGILLNGFALGAWYRVLDRYIGSDRYVRRRFVFQALSPHLPLVRHPNLASTAPGKSQHRVHKCLLCAQTIDILKRSMQVRRDDENNSDARTWLRREATNRHINVTGQTYQSAVTVRTLCSALYRASHWLLRSTTNMHGCTICCVQGSMQVSIETREGATGPWRFFHQSRTR